jgi:cytosine/adenosine deaminase-related metal-dependent hydrolase
VKRILADFLFTNTSAPIEQGILEIDDTGAILRVLSPGDSDYSASNTQYIEGWICPGFINAHCHLELSHSKGQIPERTGLNGFIDALISMKPMDDDTKHQAMREADQAMQDEGIVAVLDICNNASSFETKAHSSIEYHNLIELFGIRDERADSVFENGLRLYDEMQRSSNNALGNISPHAPYSLSPNLAEKIKAHCETTNRPIYSIHFMESASEATLFRDGGGEMAKRLKSMGIYQDGFPNKNSHPFKYIEPGLPAAGALLFVHATYIDRETLEMMRPYANRSWFAICPRANLYIENRLPDLDLIREFTDKIVLGTDSLASNHSLSILEEMKAIQFHYPEISTEELVRWSSKNAAGLIGKAAELGKIEVGMRPGLIQIGNVDKVSKKLTKSSFAKQICV